jgi:hypothetical protein
MPSTGTTATTIQANEVCVGFIAIDIAANTDSPTNSFTEVTERTTGAPDLSVLERIVSSIGAYETTVSWAGGTPANYATCGAIATFKADDANAFIGINSSAATATMLSVTENHGSSPSIDVFNASCINPNANVQASSQTSIALSTSTANSLSISTNVGADATIALSTATATMQSVVENHGSSITLDENKANANYHTISTIIGTPIALSTASADSLSVVASGGANITLSAMLSEAECKDASATVDNGSPVRRIIISCG